MAERCVSFHGHSLYSDGHSTVDDLVRAAYQTKLDYFGISDHRTTAGVPSLFAAIERINEEEGRTMVPVAACEIHPIEGEVIVAMPGVYDQGFLKWCDSIGKRKYDVVTVIQHAISSYNALVVIPHGGDKRAKGVSFDDIEKISDSLSDKQRKNLGLEVHNWSMRLFGDESNTRELRLEDLCKKHNLACLGFSDFHETWVIPEQYSVFNGTSRYPNADELYDAFQGRRIHPAVSTINRRRYIRLIYTIGKAFVRTHTPSYFKRGL